MAQFEFETVSDGIDRVRGQCSLVIDKNDEPVIAYSTEAGGLVIASRRGGTWAGEQVSSSPIVAAGEEDRVWLQIDSAGSPHVAYIEEGTRRLIYGVPGLDPGVSLPPVPTHLPPHEPVVSSVSFALHPGGQNPELRDTPHLLFEDQSSNGLGYARRIGEKWEVSQAASPIQLGDAGSSRAGQSTSLTFNESQSLQIAYVETFDGNPRTIVHTKRAQSLAEGTFHGDRRVEEGPLFIGRTSILSQTPETWVAYCDITNRVLKAGTFGSDGVSIIEAVAPLVGRTVPMLAQNPRIGGELADRLRIAFADDGKIKLAKRVRLQGWVVEVVDPDGGEMPSLAYDSQGNAHIAYAAGGALKYAKGQPE